MLSNMLKKIIIFFIPFFIINNIYAADNVIQYSYKTDDADYTVVFTVNEKGTSYIRDDIKISKISSDKVGASVPVSTLSFSYLFGEGTDHAKLYGITDFKQSFDEYAWDMGDDEFYDDLISNPEKYKPILLFDDKGNAVLIGSYFNKYMYEETKNLKSCNLNENSEYIEKLLTGKLTFVPEMKNENVKPIDIYEKMNINKEQKTEYDRTTIDETDSSDSKGNGSYTSGTCDKYTIRLRNLNEAIFGRNNNTGVCSENSLKAIKDTQSLYDLKYNFDRSILEPECNDYIFGDKGYLKTIIDSQTFYNSISSEDATKMSLSCLGMQTEYLKGISALTVYEPLVKVDKSECELISTETLDFLNSLFDAIKLIATCICIFLCVTDVYKIVITKESDVTKFRKVLVKRVVALVFLFLTPIIVNIITDLLNERYLQSNPIKCADILNSR